ncbi:hypothetical protein SRHO_G00312590 [Serrasalmus rhombeus]
MTVRSVMLKAARSSITGPGEFSGEAIEMMLRPLCSSPPCGCWGGCLPKIPFFCFENKILERQIEEECLRQLQRESRETERELEEMKREMDALQQPWTGAGQRSLLPLHSQNVVDLHIEDIHLMITSDAQKPSKLVVLEETMRRKAAKILQLKEEEEEVKRELEELKLRMASMIKSREEERLPELGLQRGMERQMKRQIRMEKKLQAMERKKERAREREQEEQWKQAEERLREMEKRMMEER